MALHLNKNFNFLNQSKLFAKFSWNYANGSGEDNFYLNFVNVLIFAILILYSLGKRCGNSFKQIHIPSTIEYQIILIEFGHVVLGKKLKKWKVYKQIDDRWAEMLTSFQLRWAKNPVEYKSI